MLALYPETPFLAPVRANAVAYDGADERLAGIAGGFGLA